MARPKKKDWQTPRVVFQPQVAQGMSRGISQVANAVRPTLGPCSRIVVNESELNAGQPEFLSDGAIIARRIVQLPGREEDVGAMYLRQILWKLHETAGDGTATAAVMFETVFSRGLRYLTIGGNAMLLRQHLEQAADLILDQLSDMTIQIRGKENLSGLAETICYDPALARMLGEIFDIIGPDGTLDIRSGRSRDLEREYVEGMYWNGAIFSRAMITDIPLGRVQLEDASILISDLEAQEPQDLIPLLEAAVQAGIKALFLVLSSISDRALALLLAKPNREKIHVVAVHAPTSQADARLQALEDLAVLTGGRAYFTAAGDTLRSVKVENLGRARRAWANFENFGIVAGRGDARKLRQHMAQLRAAFKNIRAVDEHKRLQERIGRLMGGSATLWVGAATVIELERRKEIAQRAAGAMRGALREGVLPGGGAALITCRSLLQRNLHQAQDPDEQAAYRILIHACEAPLRTLLLNAGYDPSEVLESVYQAGAGHGFDVLRGKVVDMSQAGIFDSASVVKAAVFSAIHGAALALTVDVMVHRKNPPDASATA
jgi:chaperonin GroEL